jgi:hypothetical protein
MLEDLDTKQTLFKDPELGRYHSTLCRPGDPPATGLLIGYQDLSIQYNSVQYQYKIELTYQYQFKMNPHLELN